MGNKDDSTEKETPKVKPLKQRIPTAPGRIVHTDEKKRQDKDKCRGKVTEED